MSSIQFQPMMGSTLLKSTNNDAPTVSTTSTAPNQPIEGSGVEQQQQQKVLLPSKCNICRLEQAKVTHFGVPVCTGCRAFFRRSVAQQKTYRCLGGRLCGAANPVPNRRVCKFCRFQRCVTAGMLKSKEQFQVQLLENSQKMHSATTFVGVKNYGKNNAVELFCRKDFPPNLHAFTIAKQHLFSTVNNTANIMEQFVLCRRKIAYERMQQIYMVQDGGNADNFNMKHAIQLGWKEAGLFERAFLHSLTPFQGLKQIVKNGKNSEKFFQDLDKLFLEFAFCWSTMERFWSTVRNCGHQTRRMYDLDGHYWHVNELGAQHYYGHSLVEILKDPEPAVHQAIQGFFLACAVAFLNSAKKVALAGLDEEESAALGLLVFTRQEVLGMVSVECAKVLREIRRTTLFGLAKHISSCGHSVPERLAQIVALVEPIQEIVLLCKRTSTLLRSACVEHSLPGEFQILMDKVEHEVHQLQGSSQIDLRQK